MTATFYVGDALEVMATLPAKSVDLILSSPPFLALRSYLPADHPDKAKEGGSQATPGEYIDWLVDVVEACDRVLAPHGSLCFELGDTYAASPHQRGPDNDGNLDKSRWLKGERDNGAGRPSSGGGTGWPLPKSLSLIPELFRLTLVYGTNPLTGRTTERWRLRNVIRWVRPNPPVGALGDKFRPATSELMVFCKSAKRFFDLDAVREPAKPGSYGVEGNGSDRSGTGFRGVTDGSTTSPRLDSNPAGAPPLDWWNIPLLEGEEETRYGPGEKPKAHARTAKGVGARPNTIPSAKRDGGNWETLPITDQAHPLGSPPLDWWNIPPGGYEGAHYAVWPPELCVKPIKAMSPERVCRECGEPSRRIVNDRTGTNRQPALAAHIKERREGAGLTSTEINGWFGFKEIAKNWERVDQWGAAIPNAEVWPVLKERLGLSEEFDDLIYGGNLAGYEPQSRPGKGTADLPVGVNPAGRGFKWHEADRISPTGFSDCGHNNWRPGLVLDPFVGSGTTLAVATGHGRDAVGIDLDERNYQLALDRVGPLILQRGEVAA